jgi:hypothetical protein
MPSYEIRKYIDMYNKKLMITLMLSSLPQILFASSNCDAQFLANTLAANNIGQALNLKCNLNLGGVNLQRPLILEGNDASNLTIDCQGGSIQPPGNDPEALMIRSIKMDNNWLVPSNIMVRNCSLLGSTRVMGLGRNGEAEGVKQSSHSLGHTERAQAAAPRNITFINDKFVGQGTIPLYLSPGVTQVTVEKSKITGVSKAVAVYLDAESGNNQLLNNTIDTDTNKRELVAVDGSAHNLIQGNYFSSLSNGGIYLYRNCGEGGTVRHQAPQYNQIQNNTFYYNQYLGFNPAIWVGSRMGFRLYCSADKGYPFGSSANNSDMAQRNLIANNTIITRSVKDMIIIGDEPNTVMGNVSKPTEANTGSNGTKRAGHQALGIRKLIE